MGPPSTGSSLDRRRATATRPSSRQRATSRCESFESLWPGYRDELLNPPPGEEPLPALGEPDSERLDLDASVAEAEQGPTFPPVPVVVLTSPTPFAAVLDPAAMPAGLTPEDQDARYRRAQDTLVELSPMTPQIIANGSGHYIQFTQPDLVVSATLLVAQR